MPQQRQRQKHFHGDIWFEKNVHQRTVAALEAREAQFAQDHRGDADETLLSYVRDTAAAYGYTPHAAEITGGNYIASRFGGWDHVLLLARLRPAGKLPAITKWRIYKEEFARQVKLFQRERRALKATRQEAHRERSLAAAAEQERCRARDMEWGEAHQEDTDRQLLDYVRQFAARLGHTPAVREVLGGYYISGRFGSWPVVLHLAGLPIRKGMKEPSSSTLNAYLKKQSALVVAQES